MLRYLAQNFTQSDQEIWEIRVEKCGTVNWAEFQETHQGSPIFIKHSCTKFRQYTADGLGTDVGAD